jgi:hypothetical protein
MSDSSGAPALILRVSAPVTDMFSAVLRELAVRIATSQGDPEPQAPGAVAALERVTGEVAGGSGAAEEITIEFRRAPGALLIAGRRGDRTADARHPLPA